MKCVLLVLLARTIASAFSNYGTYKLFKAEENCNVVPMTQWAGKASLRSEVLPNPVGLVVIQHTVTPEAATDAECEGQVRAIRNYHVKTLNFDDIGQSFLICGNGRVYEGAGWDRVGAHTKNFNHKAVGVTFIGDFTSTHPTQEAIRAAQFLLSCGAKNGHLRDDYKVVGHRQVSNTQSPGDELQKEIEKWPQWTLAAPDVENS